MSADIDAATARAYAELAQDEPDIVAVELTTDLRRYVRELRKQAPYREAGEPPVDLTPLFAAVRAELDGILRQYVAATSPHQHVWNDDSYCTICGLDGRS